MSVCVGGGEAGQEGICGGDLESGEEVEAEDANVGLRQLQVRLRPGWFARRCRRPAASRAKGSRSAHLRVRARRVGGQAALLTRLDQIHQAASRTVLEYKPQVI